MTNKQAADFRRFADEAVKDAEACRDSKARESYEAVARNWMRLAAIADRRGGETSP